MRAQPIMFRRGQQTRRREDKQTVEQKIQLVIGGLIVQVASLQTQLEQVQEENKALKAQMEAAKGNGHE